MYDIGDTVPLSVKIYDADGELSNASDVDLTIVEPDGTTTTPSPTNASTGVYTYNFTATQAGRHRVRWAATTPTAAYVDMFDVRSATWVGIVSLADAKAHLKIPATTTDLDEELRSLIGGITAVVEHHIGTVLASSFTETWSGGRKALVLTHQPVIEITSVTENGTTVSASGYSLSDTGILYRVSGYYDSCWLPGRNNITVVYEAGRTTLPLSAIEATKELLRINFRPQQAGVGSPWNTTSPDATVDGTWRLGFFLPHGVLALLAPEKDPGGFY